MYGIVQTSSSVSRAIPCGLLLATLFVPSGCADRQDHSQWVGTSEPAIFMPDFIYDGPDFSGEKTEHLKSLVFPVRSLGLDDETRSIEDYRADIKVTVNWTRPKWSRLHVWAQPWVGESWFPEVDDEWERESSLDDLSGAMDLYLRQVTGGDSSHGSLQAKLCRLAAGDSSNSTRRYFVRVQLLRKWTRVDRQSDSGEPHRSPMYKPIFRVRLLSLDGLFMSAHGQQAYLYDEAYQRWITSRERNAKAENNPNISSNKASMISEDDVYIITASRRLSEYAAYSIVADMGWFNNDDAVRIENEAHKGMREKSALSPVELYGDWLVIDELMWMPVEYVLEKGELPTRDTPDSYINGFREHATGRLGDLGPLKQSPLLKKNRRGPGPVK